MSAYLIFIFGTLVVLLLIAGVLGIGWLLDALLKKCHMGQN
jgi:hypothetical protein